ncbi:MAG: hypothetical protein IJ184_04920 [Alphaproteobacteria bacterium]|nr:hypothetical protein [Alphaproteobacteria bacterium]
MPKDKMTKTTTEKQAKTVKKIGKKAGWTLGILVLLGAVAAGCWQNREQLQKWREQLFDNKTDEQIIEQINALQGQLTALQSELQRVDYTAKNPDLSAVWQKVDDIEHLSANTVKSKADVEALMGLLVRMDEAEAKLRDLAKIGDEGALILTAAALVRDAGLRGGEFVYEAEVLAEVAKDHLKLQPEVTRLQEIAASGVPNVAELQRDFIAAYVERFPQVEDAPQEVAANWKDRVYNQFRKIVRIKKADDKTTERDLPQINEEERAWEVIKDYVISGEIVRAVGIAEKPLNRELLENEGFRTWLQQAKMYKDFLDCVSRISANGLAVMKVRFLSKS